MTDTVYNNLINSANDIIFAVNMELTVVIWNTSAADFFKTPQKQALGKHILEVIPEFGGPEIEFVLYELRHGKKIEHFRLDLDYHHEYINTMSISASSIIDGNTNITGFSFILREVSSIQKSELMLREREADLRLFFDFNPNYCYKLSPDGFILEVNRQALKGLGYTKHELVGSHIKKIYPQDAFSTPMDEKKYWKNFGELHNEETAVLTQSGDKRTVLLSVYAVRRGNGSVIHYMAVQQDITRLKWLTFEFERFYQAVQHSSNAVVITDYYGNITHVNRAFVNLYGYSQSEVYGKSPNILNPGKAVYYDFGYNNESYTRLFQRLWQDIKDPEKGRWEGELINKKKNGIIARVHIYINAIRGQNNTITGFVGIPIDVTDQRKMEEKIRIQTYAAIADLAEQRDSETGMHMRRIGYYCEFLATKMKMPKKFCDDIKLFAPLHDIGKVGISDSILLAPRKLSNDEYSIMKNHPEIGYLILKNKPNLALAADIVYNHHERFDGLGYPRGLKGKEIPLAARLTALADVYDALRSKRPYKEPFSHEKAADIILSGKGSHFDPEIVDLFLENQDGFVRIYEEHEDD